ncbi:MAG: AraC family transcriptional regulator [Pseudomonadales bacterium]|nr:AraC family transcriptional regulator [Pseudomonadales bacterium]
MSKRATLGFIYTLQSLEAEGADLSPIRERYGIDLKHLSPDTEIERALELQVYCDLMPSVNDPLIGLRIGQTMSLAGYGPLIMLLMTCEDAWQAFNTGIQYQALTYLFGELRLEPGETDTTLFVKPSPMPDICRRFLIDRDLSGTYQLIRDLQQSIGVDLDPKGIRIPYAKPQDTRPYENRFRCPVEFGADEMEVIIPTQYMATKFPAGNKMAFGLYKNQCDALLAQRNKNATDLNEQVRDYLSVFKESFPSSHEVATTFGLSERSFRRKLSEENTTFRKLLDQVRYDKARELLSGSNLSIESIAHQLGYAEAAAFIHAFQRWSTLTPAKFRAKNNPA